MTDAIPTPPQPPPPVALPTWVKTAMTVLTFVVGLLSGPHVIPGPPGPAPAPVPPIHQTTPDVTPAPSPIPAPSPSPAPSNDVVVSDSNGARLGGLVDPGQLVVVTSSVLDIVGVPVPAGSADVIEVSSSKLHCVIRPGGKVEVISYGAGKPAVMMIAANQGAQPPPNSTPSPQPAPNVTPVPTPAPAPQPTGPRKLFIAVVEDAGNRPPGVAQLLNDFVTWNKYKEAGNVWMLFASNTTEAKGQAAVNALKTANVLVPGLVVMDLSTGSVLYTGSLTGKKLSDITAVVNQYGGTSL